MKDLKSLVEASNPFLPRKDNKSSIMRIWEAKFSQQLKLIALCLFAFPNKCLIDGNWSREGFPYPDDTHSWDKDDMTSSSLHIQRIVSIQLLYCAMHFYEKTFYCTWERRSRNNNAIGAYPLLLYYSSLKVFQSINWKQKVFLCFRQRDYLPILTGSTWREESRSILYFLWSRRRRCDVVGKHQSNICFRALMVGVFRSGSFSL